MYVMMISKESIMYHDPKTVLSPKKVKSVEVIFDAGPVDVKLVRRALEWDDSDQ